MNVFTMRSALAFGFGFFTDRALWHALFLIGFAVIVPSVAQYAMVGAPLGVTSQAVAIQGMRGAPMTIVALVGGYFLQSVGYFSSWRIGLAANDRPQGAALYGLLAAIVAIVSITAMLLLAGLAMTWVGIRGVEFLVIMIVLAPIILVIATFYTAIAAMLGSGFILYVVVGIVAGLLTGQPSLGATLVGGSGFFAILLLVLSAIMLWLTARLSCTTSLMADRRSVNLFAAIRDSWAMTAEDQFGITRYLALLGFGLALILVAVAVAVGFGIQSLGGDVPGPAGGPGLALLGVVLGIPFAYLVVLVPAGIYRALLPPEDNRAEIFA